MANRIIRARFLLPFCDNIGREARISDGYVLIEGKHIKEVGKFSNETRDRILKEYENNIDVIGSNDNKDIPMLEGVLMPSFIKTHGHDYQSNIIGISKDTTLTQWLDEAVNPFSHMIHFQHEELSELYGCSPYYLAGVKAKLDDLSYGITASLSHYCDLCKFHVGELVEASLDCGVTTLIAVGSEDRNYADFILDPSPEVVLERLDSYFELYNDNDRIFILPGPDQFFSNSAEMLTAQKEWSRRNGTLFHTHSSEEFNTTEFFKKEYGMTPVEYAWGLGILDEDTILAHQVQNTEKDLELLSESGVNIAHNPLANTLLGSGMPPILTMMDEQHHIPIAISTDGSGSADNQNMISAIRLSSQYFKALNKDPTVLPAQKILEMCTVDAAKMLRLNKGSLSVGKDADLILFDTTTMNMTPTVLETVMENIIWASNGDEIKTVVANGELVVENFEITVLDDNEFMSIEEVKEKTLDLTERLIKYKQNLSIKGTGAHV